MKTYKGHIKNTCNSDGLIITQVLLLPANVDGCLNSSLG